MSEFSPFITDVPGDEQGRIEPINFDVPEGDYLFCLGSDPSSREGWFKLGDKFEIYQSDTFASDEKLIIFRGKWRGPESTMPAVSAIVNPSTGYALSNGETLTLAIDEGSNQIVEFLTGDFSNIGQATPAEVAAVINSAITGAVARSTGFGSVEIVSNTVGKRSRVEVVSATATALDMKELGWKLSVLVNSDELISRILKPGEEQDLNDVGVNLAEYSGTIELRFTLEVVEI
jgi:hypothetical protein